MLKDLPTSEEHFKIPNYEYLRRRDFRSHCVLSIDPSTAKDLDDALHVKMVTKGNILFCDNVLVHRRSFTSLTNRRITSSICLGKKDYV